MYKKLLTLSLVILIAMSGLSWLGYRAIDMQEEGLRMQKEGLEAKRASEFAAVAELIRRDVKRKLDAFLETESNRDYAEYQQYYVPQDVVAGNRALPILQSPLNDSLEHGFAYGHFQVDTAGTITAPYTQSAGQAERDEVQRHISNVSDNVLPSLSYRWDTIQRKETRESRKKLARKTQKTGKDLDLDRVSGSSSDFYQNETSQKSLPTGKSMGRGKSFPIESFQNQKQEAQIYSRQRASVDVSNSANYPFQQQARQSIPASQSSIASSQVSDDTDEQSTEMEFQSQAETRIAQEAGLAQNLQQELPLSEQQDYSQDDLVQVRVEPFVQLIVPNGIDAEDEHNIFDGQIFLVRHVQIEDKHFLQGFKLNEKKLIDEVSESAARLAGEGMRFAVSKADDPQAAYAAILDFDFGELILNLSETDPGWIGRQIDLVQRQITNIRHWYFGIVALVLLVVGLGIMSLWLNLREQVQLAHKKDDFISAVSHELRTPLTSIRMYTEMLEKGWIKSDDKRNEYYLTMRQESERLSRLIENVLDFSRIQRKRKQYHFQLGDINRCVQNVIDMMQTYAGQKGFTIQTEWTADGPVAFDNDAVMQIVINLLDNAIKYAGQADDKTIFVRTRSRDGHVWIEVEDRGPGIPHRQRKKIFDEFYRCQAEATRENTGAGLGLALVRKFAQAHNGFVEILNAQPTGALFRVGLSLQH